MEELTAFLSLVKRSDSEEKGKFANDYASNLEIIDSAVKELDEHKLNIVSGIISNIPIFSFEGLGDSGKSIDDLALASHEHEYISKVLEAEGNFPVFTVEGELSDSGYNPDSFISQEDLELKADITYVNTSLASKVDKISGIAGNIALISEDGNIKDSGKSIDEMALVSDLLSKIDIISGATENNIAIFNSSGEIKDSGKGIDEIALATDLLNKISIIPEAVENNIVIFDNAGGIKDSLKGIDEIALASELLSKADVSYVDAGLASKIDKVTGATISNIPVFDEEGLIDSGYPITSFAPSNVKFIDLPDTPASYEGNAGKVPAVNEEENGLEFVTVTGGGASSFIDLTDTPESYTGAGGKIVAVKPTTDGLEFIDAPSGGGGNGIGGVIYLYYSLKGGL